MSSDTLTASHEDAFNAGLKSAEPVVIEGQIVHHEDFRVSDISRSIISREKEEKEGPFNRKGVISCHTIESLAHAYEQYKSSKTRIFADAESKLIKTIFDFHNGEDEGRSTNGWAQFSADMQLKQSRKLNEWSKLTEWHDQVDFANFLEDHLEDVVVPSGQELLALATDLEANKDASFKGKMNLQDGSVQLNYQEDVQTSVAVPQNLSLGIPIFEHGDLYTVKVRLRFRVTGGGVRFKIVFTNLEDTIQHHFEELVQKLEEKVKTVVYRGSASVNY